MATEPVRAVEDHPPIVGVEGQRETEAVDYAALNAVYGVLLAGVVIATRERGAKKDPITRPELIPLSAATFALAKMIAREKIGTWVREPFVEEDDGQRPRGTRLRRAVGELVTCTRCVGAWSALGVVGLRLASPPSGRAVANVLAVSAASDWLQAGFRALCNRADGVNRPRA